MLWLSQVGFVMGSGKMVNRSQGNGFMFVINA
jgi:hypothetical protein